MNHKPNGVGLKLSNYPTDEKKFYWIVAQEGCHPKAAERILNRIKDNGFDSLTVMSFLKFDWICIQLEEIGVIMTYIEPKENWINKFNDGEWPEESLPDRFKKESFLIQKL